MFKNESQISPPKKCPTRALKSPPAAQLMLLVVKRRSRGGTRPFFCATGEQVQPTQETARASGGAGPGPCSRMTRCGEAMRRATRRDTPHNEAGVFAQRRVRAAGPSPLASCGERFEEDAPLSTSPHHAPCAYAPAYRSRERRTGPSIPRNASSGGVGLRERGVMRVSGTAPRISDENHQPPEVNRFEPSAKVDFTCRAHV